MKKDFKMGPVLKGLIIALLGLVVAVLSAVLVLVWNMPDLPTETRHDLLCLTDENGTLTCDKMPYAVLYYLERVIADESNKHSRDVEKRLQKYSKENRDRLSTIYDTYLWEMKPAAKVTGTKQPSMRKTDVGRKMLPIRAWQHGRELYYTDSFIRFGVQYRNGRLVVPVSGKYFLYSFLSLYESCDGNIEKPGNSDGSNRIEHGIYKFNILTELETEIASHVQPETISCNVPLNTYSSYVSTLADLRAGDEISVKVSDLNYLKYTRNNYFGLNLI